MKKYFLGLLVALSMVFPVVSMAAEDIVVTLSSTTPPTITKEIVDGEPYLKTNFTVNVKALNNDVYFFGRSGAVIPYLIKGSYISIPNNCSRTHSATGDISLVTRSLENYYKLTKGGQAVFSVGVSCKVREMFSGEYRGQIYGISYNLSEPTIESLWNYKEFNFKTATTQYIVGESSPWVITRGYLQGANAQSTEGGYLITLTGERLTQVTSLFVNNKTFAPLSRASSSINFLVKAQDLPLGSYAGAYLNSPTGKSNNFIIDVKGSITVIAPDGSETWTLGETKNITWDYSNVTNVSIILINKDTLRSTTIVSSMPASAKSYSWKVGNTMMGMMNPGNNYKIKVYGVAGSTNAQPIGGLGDESNSAFSIVAQPSIVVNYPKTGVTFIPGQEINVSCNAVGFPRDIKTEIQLNKGAVYPNGPYHPVSGNNPVSRTTGCNHKFTIPSSAVSGNDYSFLISSDYPSSESGIQGFSGNFSITSATSTRPNPPTITGVVLGDCLAGANCTWRAGTEKTYLWGYINPNTPANNTISVSVCSPNGATCMIAVDGSGNLLNKVPSKIGTGLGNMNGSVVALGRNVLTNPDLKSIIINGQSSLKVCPTNSDGSAVVGGVCKFSPVFTITPPLALNNSFNSQQLANLVSVLSDLLAKIKELAK